MGQKAIGLTREEQRRAFEAARDLVDERLDGATDGDVVMLACEALVADPTQADAVEADEEGDAEWVDAGSLDPSTPTCQNCGSHVLPQYVRVFSDEAVEAGPKVCPHCEDKIRSMGEIRDARTPR